MHAQAPAILLIEKDEVTLELYQRELSKSFSVVACTEMSCVLDTLATQDIRVVVIEPEINSGQGWDLIKKIQETFPDRCIPVIVCSTQDAKRASPSGDVARYMTKPVLPKALRTATLQVLGLKEIPQKLS